MSKKILLADDDEGTIGALSKVLAGYDLVTAMDGTRALELAAAEKPDLVLLDINMPGLNGLEVLKKIKGRDIKPVVIMITGDADEGTVGKALSLGVFAYLIKPFDSDQALEQVRRAFKFLEDSGG
ncbi:MAG: response regulator [Elusimicrobiales bacterium]